MTIPITPEPRRRSAVPLPIVMLLIAILVAITGITVWEMNQPEPAAGYAMTSVTNTGTTQGITLVRDNGTYVWPNPGQTLWGIKAVRIMSGTCVSINGGAQKCATSAYNYNLPLGSYQVRRTR